MILMSNAMMGAAGQVASVGGDPTIKPATGAINGSHPLASNLLFWYSPGVNGVYDADLVGSFAMTAVGTPAYNVLDGVDGLITSAANRFSVTDPLLYNVPIQSSFTLVYRALPTKVETVPAVCGFNGADYIVFYTTSKAPSNGSMRVYWDNYDPFNSITDNIPLSLNEWHIFCFRSEYIGGGQYTVDGFIDGRVTTGSGTTAAVNPGLFSSLQIGSWGSQAGNGSLSDLMIFDAALSDTEIQSLSGGLYGMLL